MMTLLRGLHSIAAQRGDGLRPELLEMTTPSPAWAEVERMSGAMIIEDTEGKTAPEMERRAQSQSAEVVVMPPRKRG